MDNQAQTRTHTQGHESHGVHVCHKCGWPFPNLHPSAKQRRAHKKICGTIEGYKLFVSEGQPHSNASDDEHLSGDDHKTQGPNSLDTSGNNEKGSGGIREKSTRSENEEFSNAVADFSDGGQIPGSKETLQDSLEPATNLEIVHRKYEEFSGSSDGYGSNAADMNHLIVRSRDDGQMQNSKTLQSERVVDGNILDLQVRLSGSTVDQLSSYIADLRTDESTAPHSDDCFGLSNDSNSNKAEATSNVLLDNKIYAGENVGGCSLTSVAKETNLKGKDQTKSDTDTFEIVVSSDNTADGAFNPKQKNSAEFLSVRPHNGLPLEVYSTVSTNASTNVIQVESAHLIQYTASSDVKTLQERGEGNVNVPTIPSCDDIPYVTHPQNEREDFKDHEGAVSQNSLSLNSSEALKQELDDLKGSVTEENNVHINQSQLSEKREVLSLDMHVLDSSMKKEQDSCESMAEEMHAKECIEVSSVELMVESNKTLDEIGVSMNAMKTEMNESHMVHFSEERVSDDVLYNSQLISLPESSFMATSNEYPVDASFGSATIETTRVISIDNRGSLSGAQIDIKDDEINSNNGVNEEECNRFLGASADSHQAQDAELSVKAAEDLGSNYLSHSSLNTEASAQCVAAVEGTQDGEPSRELSGITVVPVQDQSCNNGVKLASSSIYTSVDSGSQCDCLEANCGSLSVLSMQSDVKAVTNAEALPSAGLLASTEAGKSNLEDPRAASDRHQCEKPEMFEPPSFMTLVEPGHVVGPKADAPEVQKEPIQHLNSTSLQAGWFPTLTHVTNESQGRKRNEEIIAKVTNLSTSKQHKPLKSLLSEAALSNKPKSPKLEENIVNQKNGKVSEDNGSGLTTVNSIPGLESPAAQAVKREGGKEWNSPSRYPVNIKREKKKVKGRPYWIQFVCCSSVDTQQR